MKLERIMYNLYYVQVGQKFAVYFSYETPVAFEVFGEKYRQVVCENVRSNTTGKHLNHIEPDKTKRVSLDTFEKELDKLMKSL